VRLTAFALLAPLAACAPLHRPSDDDAANTIAKQRAMDEQREASQAKYHYGDHAPPPPPERDPNAPRRPWKTPGQIAQEQRHAEDVRATLERHHQLCDDPRVERVRTECTLVRPGGQARALTQYETTTRDPRTGGTTTRVEEPQGPAWAAEWQCKDADLAEYMRVSQLTVERHCGAIQPPGPGPAFLAPGQ
jgi:hypothetical protein